MAETFGKPPIDCTSLEGTKRDIKAAWSSFKDMFERLEKSAAENDRTQSIIRQIKIRIQNFEEARKSEGGGSGAKLLKCLSQTEKHLDTLYWLMADNERLAVKDLKREFTEICRLLSDEDSVSQLQENENAGPKISPSDTPQHS